MEDRKATLILLLILSFILASIPQIGVVRTESKAIIVPDDYSTIQDAIDNANEGDTIFVKKGTYEGPINETLIINKPISLIGEETPTLNLNPLLVNTTLFTATFLTYNTSISVESDNVTISGFTFNIPGGGISITGDRAQIKNCNITSSLSLLGSFSTISKTILKYNLRISGSNQTVTQCIIKGSVDISSSQNNIVGNAIDSQINLEGSRNTISDNSFSKIFLEHSDSNIIHNNTFSCIWIGFHGHTCSNNTISGNTLDGGYIWGILMGDGSYNVFHDNLICNYTGSHDGYGIAIGGNHLVAEYNTFYRNTLMNNNRNVGTNWQILGAGNFWDNGEVGNYWDDYNGTDNDGDGIGDVPYIVEGCKWDDNTDGHVEFIFGQDNYPLMAPITIFDAGIWEWTRYSVDVISNSTLSDFTFNPENTIIEFNVIGESGTSGFCRVTIPKELLYADETEWVVLVDNSSVTLTVNEDESNTYLYFTYKHSAKMVEIIGTTAIPEFPSWLILPLLIMGTLVGIFIRNKVREKDLE